VTLTVVARYKEKTFPIGRKRHTTHPDTSFAFATVLVPLIGLCGQRSRLDSKIGHYLSLVHINTDNKASIVKQITVTPKAAVYNLANLSQRRALEDYASDEVFRRVIVTRISVNQDREARSIRQGFNIDAIKVVNSIIRASGSSCSVVGNIGLGEKVRNVRCRIYMISRSVLLSEFCLKTTKQSQQLDDLRCSIGGVGKTPQRQRTNDWGTDDAYGIRYVRAANVGLLKRCPNLSRI